MVKVFVALLIILQLLIAITADGVIQSLAELSLFVLVYLFASELNRTH